MLDLLEATAARERRDIRAVVMGADELSRMLAADTRPMGRLVARQGGTETA